MGNPLVEELTARAKVSPEKGSFKVVRESFLQVPMSLRRPTAVQTYAAALVLAAGALVVTLVAANFGFGSPYAVAALAVLAVFAETHSVRLTPQYEVSVASITFIFAAVLFGPVAAVTVG